MLNGFDLDISFFLEGLQAIYCTVLLCHRGWKLLLQCVYGNEVHCHYYIH